MRNGVVIIAVLAGCGASRPRTDSEQVGHFECKDRLASYSAAQHMGGDELGVQLDCAEAGPRIKRWRMDKLGKRVEDTHPLAPAEFDRIWREIDGTGWVYLKDCTNGTLGKRDPIYTFDVRDHQNKATFQCQSQSVPYPYNGIVDPLDLAAHGGRDQLLPDDPIDDGGASAGSRKP